MFGETEETARETGDNKRRFLTILVETGGNVTAACKSIKIGRATAYRWRQGDEEFARHWDIAMDLSTQRLEDEVIQRATIGTSRPLMYQGRIVGNVREKSDLLLMFMLKARRPEIYRDKFDSSHGPSGSQRRAAATFGHTPAPTLIDTLGDAARAADKLLGYSMKIEAAPPGDVEPPAPAAALPAAAPAVPDIAASSPPSLDAPGQTEAAPSAPAPEPELDV